jgi:glycosyltransferase involved in cell wall biosynthesis
MRLLIIAGDENFADYDGFVEALGFLGSEAICVSARQYCFLSKFYPLHVVPFPRLLERIRRFNPDFIITDSNEYIPQMAKLVGQRVLYHMLADPWSESYFEGAMHPSLFVRMYIRYLAKLFVPGIRKVDIILPNSRWLQEKVKERLPQYPTRVLYMGINPEKWVPCCNSSFDLKHPAALGLFPFTIYPKVLGLLKFIKVIKKMPDVNFYFAGDGPYLSLVKQYCPPNMFLIGKVSRLKAKKLLESADIFTHPAGLDVLPRSVKEASLMEKPIVASDIGGIPEIVKNNQTGYLCSTNSVEQWIVKIRFLLDNPDIAMNMGKNARRFVMKTFDWKKIAEDLLNDLKAWRAP